MAVLQQLDTSWLDQCSLNVFFSNSLLVETCLNEKPKFTVWVVNGDAL